VAVAVLEALIITLLLEAVEEQEQFCVVGYLHHL
jgi:hypothetical protein